MNIIAEWVAGGITVVGILYFLYLSRIKNYRTPTAAPRYEEIQKKVTLREEEDEEDEEEEEEEEDEDGGGILTNVQRFLATVLGVALFVYIAIMVMSTLNSTEVIGEPNAQILNNVTTGLSQALQGPQALYPLLGIMVIILMLVVLVRVVSGITNQSAYQ